MTVEPDILLGGDRSARRTDLHSFHDPDLRFHQIEPSDHLGHGVFDLNSRIDLDEEELAGVGIHQEFRARANVIGGFGKPNRRVAQILTLTVGQIVGGRTFDHLLIAPLHRTFAFEQMDDIAMLIAQDLHLHVAGALNQSF